MCVTWCWRIELDILISCPSFHLLFARVLSCVSQYRFNCTLLSFHFANVSPSSGCKPGLMIKGGLRTKYPVEWLRWRGSWSYLMELFLEKGDLSSERGIREHLFSTPLLLTKVLILRKGPILFPFFPFLPTYLLIYIWCGATRSHDNRWHPICTCLPSSPF